MKMIGVNYGKRNFWVFARAIFWSSIIASLIVLFVQKIFGDFFDVVRNFFVFLCPDILECGFATKNAYYSLSLLVGCVLAIYVCRIIFIRIAPKRIIRNKMYVLKLFQDRAKNGPAPTKKILAERIFGKIRNADDRKKLGIVSEMLAENVDPILGFLRCDNTNRILCMDGKWGSGKTTSLLIAINECKITRNRYIYEAAFKYNGNIGEFINDILATLEDVIRELGVKIVNDFELLIANYDTNFKKTVINLIKNRHNLDILTSDFVLRLNDAYKKAKCKSKIFVIIDDMDRLQGEDIVEVLAFLSMLRNLNFVKIIIPVDLEVIYEALERYNVVDSPKFVTKYLPYSTAVRINSDYEMAKRVLEDKIAHSYGKKKRRINFEPMIAAIYIGMLAEIMLEETMDLKNYRYEWLVPNRNSVMISTRQNIPDEIKTERLSQLLQVPTIISIQTDGRYSWYSYYNNIRKFQNIVYALRVEVSSGKKASKMGVAQIFSEGDYAVIRNWIFPYMEKRWDIFGFTIRDAMNMLDSVKYDNLPADSVKQFIEVFNQIFPNEKLEPLDTADGKLKM